MKVNVRVKVDVPLSIAIVTGGQIKDQHMLSLGDVARHVSGIGVHQGENNRAQIIFRVNSSSAGFFFHGVRDDVQYWRHLFPIRHGRGQNLCQNAFRLHLAADLEFGLVIGRMAFTGFTLAFRKQVVASSLGN